MLLSWAAAWGKVKRRRRKRQSAGPSASALASLGRVSSNHSVDPAGTRACDVSTARQAQAHAQAQAQAQALMS